MVGWSGTYDPDVAGRLKWFVDFAIDYGSIALVALLAVGYIWAQSAPASVLGGLLGLFALKLWRDVREDRSRERANPK